MPTSEFATGGLRGFFEGFAASSNAGDVDALARLYAPTIMVAGPSGAAVVSSADLTRAIPQRRRMLDALGCRRTSLAGLEETPLDDRYTLVRAEWRWDFEPPGAPPSSLTLPSTFIVDRSGAAPAIVVYVMHQDLAAVLRERS